MRVNYDGYSAKILESFEYLVKSANIEIEYVVSNETIGGTRNVSKCFL